MAFRSVDVDAYNDDDEKFVDSFAGLTTAAPANDAEIRAALGRGDGASALKLALPSSPLVVDCLLAVRAADIPNVVKGLQPDQWDAVVKAIFGGWKAGKVDNGLLVWFEKVVEVAGLGAIVRTLTDRA
ncbi:actin-related protein 2/3 complex subunit 5 [Hyaloraphidium curvatum]|nr:actin-related protein 2/3 complex subunit 5 [Hyaloraphidium curvatum]